MIDSLVSLRYNRAFRILFIGSSASMLGSRLTMIAYPMLVLYLHGSPVFAGLAVFAATAPSVFAYMPAGALVDRWEPRLTMLAAEAGRGVVIGLITIAVCLQKATLPLVFTMAVIEEILEVFAMLAERRFVRELVEPREIRSAQVSIEARTHFVVLAGRAVGSVLFELNPVAPFLADALSFVVSVVTLLRIGRGKSSGKRQEPSRETLMKEVRGGWGWLVKDRLAREWASLSAGMTLVSQALIILFLAEAHSRAYTSPEIGVVLAASGVGGVLGTLVGQRDHPLKGLSSMKTQPVIWSVVLFLLAVVGSGQIFWMALALGVLGFTGAMGNVELETFLLRAVPEDKIARVTSISMLLDFAACALGPVLGGLLTQKWHAEKAAWILFALTAVLAVYGSGSGGTFGFRVPAVAHSAPQAQSELRDVVGAGKGSPLS